MLAKSITNIFLEALFIKAVIKALGITAVDGFLGSVHDWLTVLTDRKPAFQFFSKDKLHPHDYYITLSWSSSGKQFIFYCTWSCPQKVVKCFLKSKLTENSQQLWEMWPHQPWVGITWDLIWAAFFGSTIRTCSKCLRVCCLSFCSARTYFFSMLNTWRGYREETGNKWVKFRTTHVLVPYIGGMPQNRSTEQLLRCMLNWDRYLLTIVKTAKD